MIMTWIEKEYANAAKETEDNESNINKRICDDVTKNLNTDWTDFEQSMNNKNFGAILCQ
jgi:hypothetical protein